MATVERSATISAAPDVIWGVLADFGAISTWASNVDHSCLLSARTEGVGMVRRIQAGRMTVVETVEHWDPSGSLRYAISGLPPVVRSVTNSWKLTAIGTHSTTVALTTEIDAGSRPPQRLVAKIVGRKLAQASEQMLVGLDAVITQQLPAHGANQ